MFNNLLECYALLSRPYRHSFVCLSAILLRARKTHLTYTFWNIQNLAYELFDGFHHSFRWIWRTVRLDEWIGCNRGRMILDLFINAQYIWIRAQIEASTIDWKTWVEIANISILSFLFIIINCDLPSRITTLIRNLQESYCYFLLEIIAFSFDTLHMYDILILKYVNKMGRSFTLSTILSIKRSFPGEHDKQIM